MYSRFWGKVTKDNKNSNYPTRMHSTTESRLLQAVTLDPDCDCPRLVYADWCTENGFEDRGEFIRVQVALRVMEENGEPCEIDPEYGHTCCEYPCPICASVDRYNNLKQRERELFNAQGPNQVEWMTKGVHSLATLGKDWSDFLHWFTRGFVERVECTANDWLMYSPDCYWNPESGLSPPRYPQPIRNVVLTTSLPFSTNTYGRWPGVYFSTRPGVRLFDSAYGHVRMVAAGPVAAGELVRMTTDGRVSSSTLTGSPIGMALANSVNDSVEVSLF